MGRLTVLAASIIQSHARLYLEKKRFRTMRLAAVKIQCLVRCVAAECEVRRLRRERSRRLRRLARQASRQASHQAPSTVWVRQTKRNKPRVTAAIAIQKMVRGHRVRIRWERLQKYLKRYYAAVKIQSNVRTFHAKRLLQNHKAAFSIQDNVEKTERIRFGLWKEAVVAAARDRFQRFVLKLLLLVTIAASMRNALRATVVKGMREALAHPWKDAAVTQTKDSMERFGQQLLLLPGIIASMQARVQVSLAKGVRETKRILAWLRPWKEAILAQAQNLFRRFVRQLFLLLAAIVVCIQAAVRVARDKFVQEAKKIPSRLHPWKEAVLAQGRDLFERSTKQLRLLVNAVAFIQAAMQVALAKFVQEAKKIPSHLHFWGVTLVSQARFLFGRFVQQLSWLLVSVATLVPKFSSPPNHARARYTKGVGEESPKPLKGLARLLYGKFLPSKSQPLKSLARTLFAKKQSESSHRDALLVEIVETVLQWIFSTMAISILLRIIAKPRNNHGMRHGFVHTKDRPDSFVASDLYDSVPVNETISDVPEQNAKDSPDIFSMLKEPMRTYHMHNIRDDLWH